MKCKENTKLLLLPLSVIFLIVLHRASDISRKKSKISRDFQSEKKKKSADFAGFSREKSQILKDFQGQILRKIG